MGKLNRKKLLACGLCLSMVFSMAACGKKADSPAATTAAAGGSEEKNGSAAETTQTEAAYPDKVTEPITIQFWHTMGSGANGTYIEEAMAAFNSSNEYGITIEGTYAGSYAEVLSKTSTAIAAQDAPTLVVAASGGIPILADQGILADLSGYIARDGVDMSNFAGGMTDFCYFGDQIVSMPLNRSTAIFAYNKTLWDEMGLEPPTDIQDMAVKAAKITEAHPDIYGFGVHIDAFYFQEALVRSLGSEGLIAANGNAPASLDDGNFEKLLTDWLDWVNAGWCFPPAVTSAEGTAKEMLYNKQLASMFVSCGGLKNMINYSNEAGIELGVSYMPVYGGYGSNGGGGNICVIGKDHTQQEIAAAWEFIKFLETDEWAAKRAADTGYLPVTYSSTETETIQNLWKESPHYKTAFDQLEYCRDANWSLYQSEWNQYLKQAMSYVIQDFSMTPAEAVGYLKEQASIIFPQ